VQGHEQKALGIAVIGVRSDSETRPDGRQAMRLVMTAAGSTPLRRWSRPWYLKVKYL
jgi:hypothetical protein